MYNTDFLPQIEKFRRDLFRESCVDIRDTTEEKSKEGYTLPANVKISPCYKNINGEWNPYPVKSVQRDLEKISS